MWKVLIPQLASQYTFLKHGILACSAIHLAHINPPQRHSYQVTAASHLDLGMPLFRSEVVVFNEENCHAIFAFSHLLTVYSHASEKEDERLLLVDSNGTDAVSNWLFFLRSSCDLADSIWECVVRGPLKPLVCAWESPIDVEMGIRTPLVERLLSVIPDKNSDDCWSEEVCRIYQEAAFLLGYAFACSQVLGENFDTWDAIRVWPMGLSTDFMHLLNRWHPGAMVVFAHYCILLNKLEGKWYSQGRAKRLLGHIVHRLDPKWLCQIQEPLQVVGLEPS